MLYEKLPVEVQKVLEEYYDMKETKFLHFWSDFHKITFYCVLLQDSKQEVQLEFVRIFKLGEDWCLSRDNGYSEVR